MTHILKTDLSSLERRLNKKLGGLTSLSVLSLPNSGISHIEDCSQLSALTTVDLSGNAVASKEARAPLFAGKQLVSLDMRGCPVGSIENFRRWVIAMNPNLKMLDGKEV